MSAPAAAARVARAVLAAGALVGAVVLAEPAEARDESFEEIEIGVASDGLRKALIEPVAAAPRPGPLLIVLHDVRQKPKKMREMAGFHEKTGLIGSGWTIVHPQAREKAWNARRLGEDGGPALEADDAEFMLALVKRLAGEGRTDPSRVFVAGFGEGGAMALRLSCDLPLLFRGVAAVMATAPASLTCPKARPVPTVIFNGTLDRVAPWEGGIVPSQYRVGAGTSASVSRTLSGLSWRFGCDGYEPSRVSMNAKLRIYSGCREPLLHYTSVGGGHRWPGGPPGERDHFGSPKDRLLGPDAPEPDSTRIIADFFSSLAARRGP